MPARGVPALLAGAVYKSGRSEHSEFNHATSDVSQKAVSIDKHKSKIKLNFWGILEVMVMV